LERAGEATTGEEVGGDAREGEGTGDAGKERARKKRRRRRAGKEG
jgi:hypothetical protein